jgi:hypothetical protein
MGNMNQNEKMKMIILVGAFALLGLTQGFVGCVAFTGLGLIVWLIWRGRHL